MAEPEEKNFKGTFDCISLIPDESLREMKRKQVMAGILAGHKQIIKLSDILLSVPVLFAALSDPRRGPSLARAVVHVVRQEDSSWMEFQIDDSWRVLDESNGTDKLMHSLIKNDTANVCHFFRQFGLGLACVEEELKRLSLFNVEQLAPADTDPLSMFKRDFPVLFECLEAKFALLPSVTRIVEQKHGQLRHSLKPKAGHDFTDSQQQCLSNVEFEFREARRQSERKRKAEMRQAVERMRMSDAVSGVKSLHSFKNQQGISVKPQQQ